jgi:hypothetical protein
MAKKIDEIINLLFFVALSYVAPLPHAPSPISVKKSGNLFCYYCVCFEYLCFMAIFFLI